MKYIYVQAFCLLSWVAQAQLNPIGVVTGEDGSTIGGARVRLALQSLPRVWLNPCVWGTSTPVVAVSGAEPTASVRMVLQIGAAVAIQVNDSSQLLPQNEGKVAGANMLVGVGTAIHSFLVPPIMSQSATARTYQLVVPFNLTTATMARSSFFTLSNASGIPLPPGAAVPILVPAGQAPPTITLNVTRGAASAVCTRRLTYCHLSGAHTLSAEWETD
jgi:hypothetical protein